MMRVSSSTSNEIGTDVVDQRFNDPDSPPPSAPFPYQAQEKK